MTVLGLKLHLDYPLVQRWVIHLCHLIVFGCCIFSFSDMRFGSSSFSDLRFGSNCCFKHFGSSFSVMRFGRCSFSVMRCGSNSASCASTASSAVGSSVSDMRFGISSFSILRFSSSSLNDLRTAADQ